jgi:hypothetical protein
MESPLFQFHFRPTLFHSRLVPTILFRPSLAGLQPSEPKLSVFREDACHKDEVIVVYVGCAAICSRTYVCEISPCGHRRSEYELVQDNEVIYSPLGLPVSMNGNLHGHDVFTTCF